MKRLQDLIVLGIFLLVVVVFFLFKTDDQTSELTTLSPSDVPALQQAFETSIRSLGPEKAYAAFKQKYQEGDFNALHNFAHLFGRSLYTASNILGVVACDTDFNFGCFHGFFIAAVTTEGLEVIPRLNEVCTTLPERFLSCQHGIGHGIVEYLGHDKLTEALAACKKIGELPPIGGCTSGVFMEYNVPLSETEDGRFTTTYRQFDLQHPYDPCPSVSSDFEEACFHELPQWWYQAYSPHFLALGTLCAGVSSGEERYACYSGLGTVVAASTGYDVKKIKEGCALLKTNTAKDVCTANAAEAVRYDIDDSRGANELCVGLSSEFAWACRK